MHRPAALHSLGCSAEEIASAMQRRRDAEKRDESMKAEREKTEKAELQARAKAANNLEGGEEASPPKPATHSTSSSPASDSDSGD